MKTVLCFLTFFAFNQFVLSQERIDVTEQTIKVNAKSEEVLYYGFAEGDQIVFNFEEENGKEVSEVEIIEWPENPKYKGYEVKIIKDKIVQVNRKGVYKFRFYNSGILKGRVCRIKIQRIPKSPETMNFNTGIQWVEKFDTTYDVTTETVTTGYDTIAKQKSRRILASSDTNVVQIIDRLERVHSATNGNGSVSTITFLIPQNTYSPNAILPYKATETISWAYSIATGESGDAWYKDANAKATAKAASELAVKAGLISSGYGALALLAIEGYSAFANPPAGDNVQFRVYQGQNPTIIYGNSVAASGRVTEGNKGYFTLRLENDNIMDGINVDVKVVAVTVTKTWKDENYTVQEIESIKEKKTSKMPKVTKSKVPVLAED